MSDYMNVNSVAPHSRIVLVDRDSGTTLAPDTVVLVYVPHNVSMDDDEAVVELARNHGYSLFVDLDE